MKRTRTTQRAGATPLNANGKPRPACTVCSAIDGTVMWGRCKECRKAGRGKPVGKADLSRAAKKPAGKRGKPAPAPAPTAAKEGPRCDGAWMARARMKFKEQPAVEFLPGVQTVLKRIAAGDWPLLSEVPAVIR